MICEATGREHTTVLVHSHLECLDCRKVIESCCEGDAGRDTLPSEPVPPLGTAVSAFAIH